MLSVCSACPAHICDRVTSGVRVENSRKSHTCRGWLCSMGCRAGMWCVLPVNQKQFAVHAVYHGSCYPQVLAMYCGVLVGLGLRRHRGTGLKVNVVRGKLYQRSGIGEETEST